MAASADSEVLASVPVDQKNASTPVEPTEPSQEVFPDPSPDRDDNLANMGSAGTLIAIGASLFLIFIGGVLIGANRRNRRHGYVRQNVVNKNEGPFNFG